MHFVRGLVEDWYDRNRNFIFKRTENNPELAHEEFVRRTRLIDRLGLSRLLLDNHANKQKSVIELSNAGGFNKNGLIPLKFLRYLGFDRNVVGTVTHDAWPGNQQSQRIWRFPNTDSMINYLGLPGVGSKQVARNLEYFADFTMPVTINLMSTPGKTGQEALDDVMGAVFDLRNRSYVNRWELNISCPNTHCGLGTNARREYIDNLKRMLGVVRDHILFQQELDVKVSPDLDEYSVDSIIESSSDFKVRSFTVSNTTTQHDKRYIPESPVDKDGKQIGGASGNAVYEKSLAVQKMFEERIDSKYGITVCGGIDSAKKLAGRLGKKVNGVQIYTPLIYKGPRLVREFRQYLSENAPLR
ncbi:MAG: hypothetical protein AABY22_24185 [Nanoarchaeota archaeon]